MRSLFDVAILMVLIAGLTAATALAGPLVRVAGAGDMLYGHALRFGDAVGTIA